MIFMKIFINNKKPRILVVFANMIADISNNKKLIPIKTELFIKRKKLNICLALITQSYFAVPINV